IQCDTGWAGCPSLGKATTAQAQSYALRTSHTHFDCHRIVTNNFRTRGTIIGFSRIRLRLNHLVGVVLHPAAAYSSTCYTRPFHEDVPAPPRPLPLLAAWSMAVLGRYQEPCQL